MQHIGFYDGKGNVIHCSVEVKKQKLSEYPWTDYAIPKGMGGVIPPGPEPGPEPEKKPTIRRGSRGPYVKECQEDLLKLGYDVGKTGADEIFGKNTEAAVKAFQREHKDLDGNPLKVDGIVGQKSWGAIDDAIGKIGT
jgi:peptidoglycan hydrolase-like protein with peptidoglycan-binding domain